MNYKKLISVTLTVLVCLLCLIASYFLMKRTILDNYYTPTTQDTVYLSHTYCAYPEEANDSALVRYVFVPVLQRDSAVHDTTVVYLTANNDSVVIPITQKVYTDSTYTAYVSGYCPALDSLRITMRERIVTNTIAAKPKRWGAGVTAGYAFTPKGFQPYVGVGIHYNLLTW